VAHEALHNVRHMNLRQSAGWLTTKGSADIQVSGVTTVLKRTSSFIKEAGPTSRNFGQKYNACFVELFPLVRPASQTIDVLKCLGSDQMRDIDRRPRCRSMNLYACSVLLNDGKVLTRSWCKRSTMADRTSSPSCCLPSCAAPRAMVRHVWQAGNRRPLTFRWNERLKAA
jgi:hypothetical protein